jgi:16S rRNA (guanine527-N7)-methyltransferase
LRNSPCRAGVHCRIVRGVSVSRLRFRGVRARLRQRGDACDFYCRHRLIRLVRHRPPISRSTRHYNYVCSRYYFCLYPHLEREPYPCYGGSHWSGSNRGARRIKIPPYVLIMSTNRHPELTNAQILDSLSPFLFKLSEGQIDQIREYVSILIKWNQSISLTSIADPIEIVARHFGESVFLCSLLPVENGRLADVGSGAGFPGLALKIVRPGLSVVLIESNKKKCAFLSEVVRALHLSDVDVMPTRFEDIRAESGFADFVTARALGGFSDLLRWSKKALPPRGHVILWVGGDDSTVISKTPGWIWQPAVRIPESQRRFIQIGRPHVEAKI